MTYMYNVKQEVTVTILASHDDVLRGSSHVPAPWSFVEGLLKFGPLQ